MAGLALFHIDVNQLRVSIFFRDNVLEMLDKPYLRKIETIEDFEVWEIDGKYIRDNIDVEFTNFGQHFRFKFIPVSEFWIDKEFGSDEAKYFVDHMIMEWSLMKEGKSYSYAAGVANKVEMKERKKSGKMKKAEKELRTLGEEIVPKKIYKERLIENGGVAAWIVDGELVRDLYYIEFTEGGHHFVYDFIPYNEVWLDDDLNPKERHYVLLHELRERYLMHSGLTYSHAHHSSSIIEYKCRSNPTELKRRLVEEMEKNKAVVKNLRDSNKS